MFQVEIMSDADLFNYGTTQIKMVLSRIRRKLSRALEIFGSEGKARVGIYGPPNAGKCLAPNEKVLLSDGKHKRIDEIYREIKNHGGKQINKNPNEKWIKCDKDLKVPSASENLEIQQNQISYAFRQKYEGPMYEIETMYGRKITVSPQHPFITPTNNGINTKKAKNIEKDDKIALLKKYTPRNPKKIKKKITTDGGKLTKNNNRKQEILQLIAYLTTKANHTNKYIEFVDQDPQTTHKIKSLLEKQNIKFIFDNSLNPAKIKINKSSLKKNIDYNIKDKKIPDKLLKSGIETTKTFIKEVFKYNGKIEKTKRKIKIKFQSNSRDLIVDVQLLLNKFGVIGKIKENTHQYELLIQERNLKTLQKILDLNNIDTQTENSLDTKIKSTKDRKQTKRNIKKKENPQKQDITWDRIKDIEKIDYNGYIYDLTIEENHTFTTHEGLIVHNTTLANRISEDWTGETVGSESSVPHETRKAQRKKDITIQSNGASLTLDIVDTPGVATKVDYEDFMEYGLEQEDAVKRSREATEGVAEAMGWLKEDLDGVVYVLDSTLDPFTQVNTMLIGIIESRSLPVLVVANKIDLDDSSEKRVQEAFPQHETVPLSALEGNNIQNLYDKMAEKFV